METLESVSKSLLILNRGIMQRQGLSSVMTRTDTLNELTVISLKHAGERLRWISICTIGWLHVSVWIKPAQIYIDVQYMRVWHTTKKSVTPRKKITLLTKQMRDVRSSGKKTTHQRRCLITQWSKWRLVSCHAPWDVSLILSSFPFFCLFWSILYFLPWCVSRLPVVSPAQKYFHLPLIIHPSRGAFHYTNIASPQLFLLFLPWTGAARRKRLRISRKRHPLLKLCCTAVLPLRKNLKNLMTTSEF